MQTAFPTVYPIRIRNGASNQNRRTGGSACARSSSERSPIYAGRLFSRRAVDVRARLVVRRRLNGRIVEVVVHGRTVDLSRSGAGLTLFRELPAGAEVALSLQLPDRSEPFCLRAVIVRRRGFRVGLLFVEPTAEQRLRLFEFCYA